MKDIDLITKKPTEEIVLETKCSETVETLKTEPAVILSKRIDNEISRATEAEKNLDSKIDAETARAAVREDELESKIKQSGKVDDVLVDDVSVLGEDKIARIDLTPYAKQSDLSSEIDRAKESESSLSSSLDTLKSDLISEAIRAAYLTASKGQTLVCGFKIKDLISPTATDTGDVVQSQSSPVTYGDWIIQWAQAFIDNIDDLWDNGLEEIGEVWGEWGTDKDACVEYFQQDIIDSIDDCTASMLNVAFQKFTKHWDILKKYPATMKIIVECFTKTSAAEYEHGYNRFTGKSTGDYINRIENGSTYYIDSWDDDNVYFNYVDKAGTETDVTISRADFESGAFFFEIINTGERAYTPEIKFNSFETDKTYDLTDEQYTILSNTGYSSVYVIAGVYKYTFHRASNAGGIIHTFTCIEEAENQPYYHIYSLWVVNKKARFTADTLPTYDDLTSETSAREEADKTLQTNIDANEEAIMAETTRATAKETELENAIKEAGKIDDVKVNDVSVVTDKVANIDLTSYAKTSDLSSYVKKSGDTMTGTLNVPTIEGVSTITAAEDSLIVDAKRPRLTKINGASLNYNYQFPVLNPTDSALCTTGGNLTYNGKSQTLAVSNINSESSSGVKTISTGINASSYFQAQKFRGQGNASTYNHAIDFGYAGHDRVDFYEYGGVYNFWQNQSSFKLEGDKNRVASLQLGKLLERGYTLTYPGKSGTFALTSDFADYATTAYVDEKTALPKITITKDQFTSSKSVKLTDEQNAILIDTNNDAVLVDLSSFGGTYPNIVLHRQISSAWLFLFTSAWNAELFTLENGVARLKKFLVLIGINDGVQPNYPTADIVDLDTIDFPTITLSKSQVTSVSEDGNSMELTLTDNQYNILCDSLYRAVKVDASGVGLWNDGVIYKLNDDSTDPVYTFFSVSASKAGIGRIFVDSDRTAKVYITYAVSKSDYSKHIHDSVVSNGDGTYMLVFGAPGTGD